MIVNLLNHSANEDLRKECKKKSYLNSINVSDNDNSSVLFVQKVAAALQISVTTVYAISKSASEGILNSPNKKRKVQKPKTDLDTSLKNKVREMVYRRCQTISTFLALQSVLQIQLTHSTGPHI